MASKIVITMQAIKGILYLQYLSSICYTTYNDFYLFKYLINMSLSVVLVINFCFVTYIFFMRNPIVFCMKSGCFFYKKRAYMKTTIVLLLFMTDMWRVND